MSFKKGDLVQLIDKYRTNPSLRFCHKPSFERRTTQEEVQEWRNSPESKGINSAGESKLPPMIAYIDYDVEDTFTIVRARCAPKLGYYKKPKSAKVMNNRTNEVGYIERKYIEKV